MNAVERNRYTEAWRRLGAALPLPRGIVVVSAHWYGDGLAVTAMERPRTIHDFYGFPRELYAVSYDAPGSPELARRVAELLAPERVALDRAWGFDHGAWSVLVHLFPDANVPVVQLSLDARRPPEEHWELGERLGPLRDEGVLVVGSGNVVHNLRLADFGVDGGFEWAVRFDDDVRRAIEAGDRKALTGYPDRPAGMLAVPTPDHYLPLLYAAALRRPGETTATLVDGMEAGALSMRAVRFG